jgi:FOG: HEAT repeat
MKKNGIAVFCVAFFLCASFLFAEQTEKERRHDVIAYGLEGEITDLVATLANDNDDSCNQDLLALFSKTRSSTIRESILGLFAKQKKTDLRDYSLSVLDDPYDTKKTTVAAVFSYAVDAQLKDALPAIRKILSNENSDYRDQAINALGKLGEAEDAKLLADYIDGDFPGDEKQRLIIRQNVMAALGSLKSAETLDKLTKIAEDENENASIRATAATAVGAIGKPESIPLLVKLFESSDPMLRAASVASLATYSSKEAVDTVIEGFKDSYYKVRLESISAAQKLKLPETVPYILYRAKSDPVKNVQLAAYDALGTFNDSDANAWLKSVFLDDKKPDEIRVKACGVLMKNNFDFIFPDVEKVVTVVLKDDKKIWLRYEIGKLIAATDNQATSLIAQSYLSHKDATTRSLGLDMYSKNKYASLKASVEAIAADEKQGALQRRAKKILE